MYSGLSEISPATNLTFNKTFQPLLLFYFDHLQNNELLKTSASHLEIKFLQIVSLSLPTIIECCNVGSLLSGTLEMAESRHHIKLFSTHRLKHTIPE